MKRAIFTALSGFAILVAISPVATAQSFRQRQNHHFNQQQFQQQQFRQQQQFQQQQFGNNHFQQQRFQNNRNFRNNQFPRRNRGFKGRLLRSKFGGRNF